MSGAHQQLHDDDLVLGCSMSFFQFALQMNFLPSLADGPPTTVHSQAIVPVSLFLLQVCVVVERKRHRWSYGCFDGNRVALRGPWAKRSRSMTSVPTRTMPYLRQGR